ncbi:hypothetical protein GVN20_23780 [Runella sp. CRIBMP]|uniref:hypothetical protein n=1 Tax=Runella sp. CRIBMP TaxID=2683261 RepID=UPI0014126211|nr:hypothetical protein [Runella sp. CRIBMP]NBB22394.1 hypothetical protein [Runella sp. CRIBMP]
MWTHKNTFAIGGLENIGYADKEDFLIVLSSQGQGIFNCKTGEKIARLNNDSNWWDKFDQSTNSIVGFDILENIEIKTYGLYGSDNLAKTTQDNWTLIISEPEPDDRPFEKYLVQKIYLLSPDGTEKKFICKDGACELRAFGFSETGDTFVIALSCDLTIYSRT